MSGMKSLGEPKIVQGEPMIFAGEKIAFKPETMSLIPELWRRFGPRIDSIPNQLSDAAFGVGINLCNDDPNLEYLAAVHVTDASSVPADLTALEAPARLFVVFDYIGNVAGMGEAINAIWRDWMPTSGYRQDIVPGAPDVVERYGPAFDPVTGKGDLTLWIPIKPAEA